MSVSRGLRLGTLLVVALAAMMSVAMISAAGMTPNARAAGVGPCMPLTASDMAQPQVTYKGHASLHLSRLQGTDGTLLTMSGGGWPAKAHVVVDIWTDVGNQFLGGPFNTLPPITITATGALPTTSFRLATDESAFCPQGIMTANGVATDHVTMLLVAQTVESGVQNPRENPRARVPVVFTVYASPHVNSPSVQDPWRAHVLAGASMPLVGSGWQPGDMITVTSMITPFQPDTSSSITAPTATPTATPAGSVTVTADPHGAFTLPYRLPNAPPLSVVSLLAHTNDARFGDVTLTPVLSFLIVPDVYPSIQLDKSAVLAGGTVTVTGDHWTPGEHVTVEYCRGLTHDLTNSLYCDKYSAESLAEVQADGAGHFVARVRLPINARVGPDTMQARITGATLWTPSDTRPFAAAQQFSIVDSTPPLSYAQQHPVQAWLLAHTALLGGALLTLLAVAFAGILIFRRRRDGEPQGA